MEALIEVLRILLAVTFLGLAAAAINQWRHRNNRSASWLVATFAILGVVATVDLALAEIPPSAVRTIVQRGYVALLVFYPFCLYKFASTFRSFASWIDRSAELLTAGAFVFALLADPETGSQRTLVFQIFLTSFSFQWIYLSSLVTVRLWSSGKGQPTVARRRMWTMALGSGALSLTIVLAGLPMDPNSYWGAIFRITALLSGPLFVLGFAPPSWVLAVWRRKDEAALRDTEIGLMVSLTPPEVATSLLPKLSQLVGAQGALLVHDALGAIGVHNLDAEQARQLTLEARARKERSSVVMDGADIWFPLQAGWLIVVTSPYTPFFGQEEVRTLEALSVLTDLAISRADLFERERRNAEAMRDFVAIASHDLRTPITVLNGFAQILRQRSDLMSPAKQAEILRAIDRQSTHLTALVEDLLTVSRIEAEALEPQPREVDLRAAALAVAQEAGLHGAQIDVRVDEGATAWVDPEHMHRILMNYVMNAINYGASPFSIESRTVDDHVELRVSDGGSGVPQEFKERLFERFSRYDKKIMSSSHGTGLGLSIVRGLARAAGGDAWYEPNRPRGSVFAVRLPIMEREAVAANRG